MARDRVRIVSLFKGSLVLEDVGVRLEGPGSSTVISADAARASKDLACNKALIRIVPIPGSKVPLWPFLKPPAPAPSQSPAPEPSLQDGEMAEIRRHVRNIDEALQALLSRPQSAPPEVIAAHVRTIGGMPSIPSGLPGAPVLAGAGSGSDPMFLPSKIVPDHGTVSITVHSEEVEKAGIDDDIEALRRARGRGPVPSG